jgi:copper chaperone CopZ
VATTVAFVRQLPGILDIDGNLSEQTLIVTFDPAQVSKEEIIKTIEDLGYTVTGEFTPPGE